MVVYKAESIESFDALFNLATSLGAIDLEEDGEGEDKVYAIICSVEDFGKVRDGLYAQYSDGELARLSWRPKQRVLVDSPELNTKLMNFLNDLEDNDDVQYVEGDFSLVG